MSVISTTMCYPSPTAPTHGVFVRRRLREIHRLMPVTVVAPVPWFPLLARVGFDSFCGVDDEPPVWRPRMFYLPGVLKPLDGRFYGRAFERGLSWVADRARFEGRSHDCGTGVSPVRPPPRRRCHNGVRPDLIEAHFVWPDGVGAWRVARKLGVQFVCTIRGKLVSQIAERSKRRQIREMLLGADGLIAVSQSLADLADEVAGRALGARVIPNGVDTKVFRRFEEAGSTGRQAASGTLAASDESRPSAEARAACGWSDAARYAVSVGHLQALKGFHRLVEVWPDVRRRMGDVRLVLVGGEAGEPGYMRQLRGRIEATGLGPADGMDIVTMTGRVKPGEVATMLNAADLFVLASRSEGWCNAIAESLACGCPVVATDVGGNPEIVSDAALGRLVPLDDRGALTEAIFRALAQDWDRRHIANLGSRRDWQQVARECVDVFEGLKV